MLIESHLVRNHLLIHILEDILMDNSRDFYLEFEDIFAEAKEQIHRISLDFSDVRFLDSSGIGAIIKASNKVKETGKEILVLNLNKTLTSVFRLSGLENILVAMEGRDFIERYPEFEEFVRINEK